MLSVSQFNKQYELTQEKVDSFLDKNICIRLETKNSMMSISGRLSKNVEDFYIVVDEDRITNMAVFEYNSIKSIGYEFMLGYDIIILQ